MISYSTTTSSNKEENERKIDKDFSIILNKQLGKGGFGQLYLGKNYRENIYIAIKVEEENQRSHLKLEYEILKEIKETVSQKYINIIKDINIIIYLCNY